MSNFKSAKPTSELAGSFLSATGPIPPTLWSMLRSWNSRQRWSAVFGAVAVAIGIGIPTDVIPNPVFGRPIPVTWWSYPVLVITAVLGGLLIATYVHVGTAKQATDWSDSEIEIEIDSPSRQGSIGGLLSFFAVGCPVCN